MLMLNWVSDTDQTPAVLQFCLYPKTIFTLDTYIHMCRYIHEKAFCTLEPQQ